MRVKLFAGVALLAIGLGLAGSPAPVFAAAATAVKDSGKFSEDTYKYLELFGDVFERVRKDYVEEVSDQTLLENAINGMLTGLDPHSSYMPAKGNQEMQEQMKGEFGGLGIEVTMEGGLVKVVSPIDDTPASKAGVQPGDFIIAIDGKPAIGLTLNEAVDKMRGPLNSSIVITLRRIGVDPFDVKLTRAVIKVQSVASRAEGDVGYIRISGFTEQTQTGLDNAIKKLKASIGPEKIKGYVVDLRNNPGGLLDQAVSVSDTFLDRGEIVSTRSRRAEETQRYNAKPGDATDGKPLVVLINDGSASASEIVAGALQDYKRATIMGSQTFGKGSVQTIRQLTADTAIKLTTARYYTPNGRSIQAKGIVPDVLVDEYADGNGLNGLRLREADLQKHLRNDKDKEDVSAAKTELLEEEQRLIAAERKRKPQELGTKDDFQLTQALNFLKGAPVQVAKLKEDKKADAESPVSGKDKQ